MITHADALGALGISLEISRDDERAGPGVYFLVKDGVIVYVGQTCNVLERVSQHASGEKEREKDFDSAYAVLLPERDIKWVEACLINGLKPSHNRQTPKLLRGFHPPHGTSQAAKDVVRQFCFISR